MAGSKPAALPLGDTPTTRTIHFEQFTQRQSQQTQPLVQRRRIQRPRDEASPAVRHFRGHALRIDGARKRRKQTCTGSRELRRAEPREPVEGLSHLGESAPYDAFAIVSDG